MQLLPSIAQMYNAAMNASETAFALAMTAIQTLTGKSRIMRLFIIRPQQRPIVYVLARPVTINAYTARSLLAAIDHWRLYFSFRDDLTLNLTSMRVD